MKLSDLWGIWFALAYLMGFMFGLFVRDWAGEIKLFKGVMYDMSKVLVQNANIQPREKIFFLLFT